MPKIIYISFLILLNSNAANAAGEQTPDWDVECGTQIVKHAQKYQPENLSKLNKLQRVGAYLVGENSNKELVVLTGKRAVLMKGPNLSCSQTPTDSSLVSYALAQVAAKYPVTLEKISDELRKENEEYKSLNLLIHYCRSAKDPQIGYLMQNFGWQQGGPPPAEAKKAGGTG